MSYKYTIPDYIAAIEREQAKRATTYPKILKKMERKDVEFTIYDLEIKKQFNQNQSLNTVLDALKTGVCKSHVQVSLAALELEREYKMRKRCYPRFIYFKRITQETADYEMAIWSELFIYFVESFLTAPIAHKKSLQC